MSQQKIQYKFIKCLDSYIDTNHIGELTAPEAAEVLEKAGLLKDSDLRKGLPLRDLLRAGEFGEWAYQIGSIWHIKRSSIKWPKKKK